MELLEIIADFVDDKIRSCETGLRIYPLDDTEVAIRQRYLERLRGGMGWLRAIAAQKGGE